MSDHDESSIPNYEETLSYSQGIRRRIVDKYFAGGEVPNDPKDVETVLKALKDMDSTAINDRKNNIDQATADSSKEVATAMRDMVLMQQNRNPFERSSDGSVEENVVIPEANPEKLGEHELVEGEEEIGVIAETSTDFMKRMEERHQANTDEES